MLLESVDVVGRASQKFVVSLDVGTTTIRAFVYDEKGHIRGRDLDKVRPLRRFAFFGLFNLHRLVTIVAICWPILPDKKWKISID